MASSGTGVCGIKALGSGPIIDVMRILQPPMPGANGGIVLEGDARELELIAEGCMAAIELGRVEGTLLDENGVMPFVIRRAIDPECRQNMFRTVVCEKGTIGCEIDHA